MCDRLSRFIPLTLAVSFLLLIVSGCITINNPLPAAAPTPAPVIQVAPAATVTSPAPVKHTPLTELPGYLPFTDQARQFTMLYPSLWYISRPGSLGASFISSNNPSDLGKLALYIVTPNVQPSQAGYDTEATIKAMKDLGWKITQQSKLPMANDLVADFVCFDQNQIFNAYIFLEDTHGYHYIIDYTCPGNLLYGYNPIFVNMNNSFRFLQ